VVIVGLAGLAFGVFTLWIAWNREKPRKVLKAAEARTLLDEARANLAIDRAAEANRTLERASNLDPTLAEAWQIRLDRLRVLDRPLEALKLAREAEAVVDPTEFRPILASATLAMLAELPDDQARDRLDRWIKADPDDFDARVARLARIAANPHPGDPDRASRIAELQSILDQNSGHLAAREALLIALADEGEPERGRIALEGWPVADRDARYFRLRGRWDLDYDHRPDRAAEAYARALVDLPHDWKSHYGLARAYKALGRENEAKSEAEAVARLRERLAPTPLAARLTDDLAKLDDLQARQDLAALCESVGLTQLAEAWTRETLPRPSPRSP
jgi:tetratricopeptide (TPR) repeat protein